MFAAGKYKKSHANERTHRKKCFTLMQTDGPLLYEIYGIASTT